MNCTIAISRYGSYASGKYGLTIHRPGQGTANVRYVGDDNELRTILDDLGFKLKEVKGVLEALDEGKSKFTASRVLTESKVAHYGF